MKKILVTESRKESVSIDYLAKSLQPLCLEFGGKLSQKEVCKRVVLQVSCPEKYLDLFKSELEDKIADVVAIRYKYKFFKKRLKVIGLSDYDIELLFSAIISADAVEDKRYIIRKIRNSDIFSIDGIFNFRLQPLKGKWQEVVDCIPPFFTKSQLSAFITFLIGEKKGKKVIVEDEKVYDSNYNLLQRSKLLDGKGDLLREVLLSNGATVEVVSSINESQARQLKTFFGRRISFLKGSLSKMVDKKV